MSHIAQLVDQYLCQSFMCDGRTLDYGGSPFTRSGTPGPFDPEHDAVPDYCLHLWPVFTKVSGRELYTLATHVSEEQDWGRITSLERGELSDTVYVLTDRDMRSGEWRRMVDVPHVREAYEMRGEATIPNNITSLCEVELAQLADLVYAYANAPQ